MSSVWRESSILNYTSIMRSVREPLMARGSGSWRVILGLAVFAMLFKAWIPAGYMPDAHAAREGKLLLSMCLPSGHAITVPLALESPGTETPSNEANALQECPFVLAAVQAVLPELTATTISAAFIRANPPRVVYRTLPPLLALGPPLGSRAPPRHLA